MKKFGWIFFITCIVFLHESPTDGHAAYIENILTLQQPKKADRFGWAVSVSGDYCVIGSPEYLGIGKAYIFKRQNCQWVQMAVLTSSDGATNDRFGCSVAIDGDIVVVGAYFHSTDGIKESGKAYIYQKPVNGWEDMTQTAILKASDTTASARFGNSVAIYRDVIVVGSYFLNQKAGAAYIFIKPTNGWAGVLTENTKLTAKNPQTSGGLLAEQLGVSVSIYGDTVVAGADYYDASTLTDIGAVYVFIKPENGWTNVTSLNEAARLTPTGVTSGTYFGRSVAIYKNTIVVGAPSAVVNNVKTGAAFIFEKPDTGWTNMQASPTLLPIDGNKDDKFGDSVAIDKNIIIVGAPSGDTLEQNTGLAYMFVLNGDTYSLSNIFSASNRKSYYQYGSSVSISDSYVIIGAFQYPGNSTDFYGAAYTYCIFDDPTDIDCSGFIDLNDMLFVLQILAGLIPDNIKAVQYADINNDTRIGMEEAIYILQRISSLR